MSELLWTLEIPNKRLFERQNWKCFKGMLPTSCRQHVDVMSSLASQTDEFWLSSYLASILSGVLCSIHSHTTQNGGGNSLMLFVKPLKGMMLLIAWFKIITIAVNNLCKNVFT